MSAEAQIHESLLSFLHIAGLGERTTPDSILHDIGSTWRLRLAVIICALSWGLGASSLMTSAFTSIDSRTTNFTTMYSVVDEFSLIDENAYLADWSTSFFMVGNMLGGSVLAHASDKYGRKPTMVTCVLIQSLSAFAAALAPNIMVFTLCRVVQGACYLGATLIGWVLAYEHSSIDFRKFTTLFFGLSWVLGSCAVAPMAYISPSWRILVALGGAPLLVYVLLCIWFVPETLHFLIAKGKAAEIEAWILAIGGTYAEKFDVHSLELSSEEDEMEKKVSFVEEIWNNKRFIVYCIVQVYLWTCDNFIYFGLSLFSTQLAGNLYVNYILMGIVELPAYMVAPVCLDTFGRRATVAGAHLLAAFSFFVLLLLPEEHPAVLFCWLVGKFSISCSFISLFVYAIEVFPTSIRNVSVGICSVISRSGGIMAPYIRLLASISSTLPLVLLFCLSCGAGLVTFLLPETNKKPLPSSMSV